MMKKTLYGLVLAGSLTACGTGNSCEKLCDTYASVGCENFSVDDCSNECVKPEACTSEYNAYLNCTVAQTSARDYICDEDGDVIGTKEVCTSEAVAFLACAFSEMDSGDTDE